MKSLANRNIYNNHTNSHIFSLFWLAAIRGSEAYWVLFRFLYGGQLADPSLIIHIDDVGWSAVSERFV